MLRATSRSSLRASSLRFAPGSSQRSVKMASCCPPSAGPGVKYDYSPKGAFEHVSADLEAYVTGSSSKGRGIVLIPGEGGD